MKTTHRIINFADFLGLFFFLNKIGKLLTYHTPSYCCKVINSQIQSGFWPTLYVCCTVLSTRCNVQICCTRLKCHTTNQRASLKPLKSVSVSLGTCYGSQAHLTYMPEGLLQWRTSVVVCRKFQISLAFVLFGVNDKTEARVEGEKFRHKVRLSSARSPKSERSAKSAVMWPVVRSQQNKVLALPPKRDAHTSMYTALRDHSTCGNPAKVSPMPNAFI